MHEPAVRHGGTRATSRGARRSLALIAVAAVLATSATARAEESRLQAALSAYDQGELDQALEAFDAALRSGLNGPEDLVTIHVHLGVLRGAGGDVEAARRSFEVALALNPALPTPSEAGGQLRTLFEDLRAARAGRGMAVELRPAGGGARVEAAAINAPPGLVAGLRLRATSGPQAPSAWTRELNVPGPSIVMVPDEAFGGEAILALSVDALDEHGNRLARALAEVARGATGDEPVPAEISPDATHPEPSGAGARPPSHRGRWAWYEHPAFWVAIGLVVAGGVTAGIVVGTSDDRYIVGAPQVR
jgi:tetratricopeptide (TPR) repeat protein